MNGPWNENRRIGWALIFSTCCSLLLSLPAVGAIASRPPWEKMLDGLIEKRYYDVAIDYLERQKNDSRCPEELKEQIDFRIGMLHFNALAEGNAPLGDAHLSFAIESLRKFLDAHPAHPEAYTAYATLGKAYCEEAARLMRNPSSEQHRTDARSRWEAARDCWNNAEKIVYEQARQLQSDPLGKIDAALKNQKELVYERLLSARIRAAAILLEHAKTYPADAPEYRNELIEAVAKLHEIAVKYKDYAASLEAKLIETQANRLLGNSKETRILLQELMIVPELNPFYRAIRSEALVMILELNLEEPSAENLRDSLERIESWTETVSPQEKSKYPASKIAFLAGKTYLKIAETSRGNDARKAKQSAARFLSSVPVGSRDSEEAARLMLTLHSDDSSGSNGSSDPAGPGENATAIARKGNGESGVPSREAGNLENEDESPKTFDAAKSLAERKFQEFSLAMRAAENPVDAEKAERFQRQTADEAVLGIRKALELRTDSVPATELNALRLRLASVFWIQGRMEELIVVGDFLSRRYYSTKEGMQGAELAIKGLKRLYYETKKGSENTGGNIDANTDANSDAIADAIADRIVRVSDRIARRWDSLPLGAESRQIRMEIELESGRFDAVRASIDALAEQSEKKGVAQRQFGQALWESYVKRIAETNSSDASGEEKKKKAASNENLLQESRTFLERGLARRIHEIETGSPLDYPTLVYQLTLAQVQLNLGDTNAALASLNHPLVGPLPLVLDGEPSASDAENRGEGEKEEAEAEAKKEEATTPRISRSFSLGEEFKTNVLIVALRVYVGCGDMENAEKTIAALERTLQHGQIAPTENANPASNEETQKRLANVFLVLAAQLESRLKTLEQSGKREERDAVLAGFNMFLERIAEQQTRLGNVASLRWVADMYYRLGEGLVETKNVTKNGTNQESTASEERARPYFTKSVSLYRLVLQPGSGVEKDPVLRLRFARALRRSGTPEEAFGVLRDLLRESENRLDVQMEAAETLQSQGKTNPEFYYQSITGTEKKTDGRNLVWGWNGIIERVAQAGDRFKDAYYESYYNKTVARMEWARSRNLVEKKAQLEGAQRELTRLKLLHPDLGGPDRSHRFAAITEQIRRELQATPAP